MATKKQTDPKAETAARIKRTEAYAESIRLMFATTVNQILALNRTLPHLEPGVMFSFDGQSKKKQNEVERLLRQLHSVATMAIQQGITLEWSQANAATDALINSLFGKKVLSSPEFTAWSSRNSAAMNAFIKRTEKGLNLSERVWKAVKQLKDEMEVAMTVSIGEGQSAQKMSQSVRKYLNDPDLMFRRFRYKAGEEPEYDKDGNEIGKKIVWGKKWKKRIKKPDGTYGWIDYDRDSYKTGNGVYKSSAKNAMRVARTETNIAYRRADHERWQQLDFVLGQRVQLSRNHPKEDICDKLAGDYPKDFVFDGWHPQCFCYVTTINLPIEDMVQINKIMDEGGDWKAELKRLYEAKRIKSYPENFKEWVRDNAENIAAARERGTEPYFIRNNSQAIDKILNPEEEKTKLKWWEKEILSLSEDEHLEIINDYFKENPRARRAYEKEWENDLANGALNLIRKMQNSENSEFLQLNWNLYNHLQEGMKTPDGFEDLFNAYKSGYYKEFNKMLRQGITPENEKLLEALDYVTTKNSLLDNLILRRNVGTDFMRDTFGITESMSTQEILAKIKGLQGSTFVDEAFISTSGLTDRTAMSHLGYSMKILAPKDTKGYVSSNVGESEILLARGTQFKIIGVKEIINSQGKASVELVVKIQKQRKRK